MNEESFKLPQVHGLVGNELFKQAIAKKNHFTHFKGTSHRLKEHWTDNNFIKML